jgi:Chromo (CHRromatin Organisation MOdifier) domain
MGRIHPIFHVEKLKRYTRSTVDWPGRQQLDRPVPVWVDGEEKWEVDRIIGKREALVTVPIVDDDNVEGDDDGNDNDGADGAGDAADGLRRSARLRSQTTSKRTGTQKRRQRRARRATQQVRQVQYLVAWKGYDESQATWQTEDDLVLARDAVDDYEHQQRLARGEEALGLAVVLHPDGDGLRHTDAGDVQP